MKFKNHFNKNEFPDDGEINDMPSMTVPDMAMSMKDIMKRFASGLPIEGERVPFYGGEDDDLPDFSHMDPAELEEYRDRVSQELKELNRGIAEQKEADQRKELERTSAQNPEQSEDDPQPKNKPIPKPPRRGAAGGNDEVENPPKQA